MKSIRNIAFAAIMTIGAFSAVTYTSCNKDECKDVVCQNGGTCNDGDCACATGYEGTTCGTEVREKVIKTWTSKDVDVSDNEAVPTYSAIISKGTTVTDVLISRFSNGFFDRDVKGTITGNTITIPSQTPDNDGYKIEGTLSFNSTDKTITATYTLTSITGATASYKGTWN